MRTVRVSLAGLATMGVLVACGGDGPSSPTPPVARGIRIISGANVTDSVGTKLAAPLIVEVRDSTGAIAPLATVVRFETVLRDQLYEATLAPLSSDTYAGFASGTTDASGRAGAFVAFGTRPGTVRVAISVPTLGLSDTARFTISVGGPARLALSPHDTSVFVGKTFTVQARSFDRFSNARPDTITYAIGGTGASVTSAGVVTAIAVGRHWLRATAKSLVDSVQFGVVPRGTLAAFDINAQRIITIDLEGGNFAVRTRAPDGGIGVRPRWVPGTNDIIYSAFGDLYQELRVVDPAGATRPFLAVLPAGITHAADPAPSANGAWVYFAAHNSACASGDYCLHRARSDGTGVESMAGTRSMTQRSFRPSPSPDGRQVAFQYDEPGESRIQVLNADQQLRSSWSVPGVSPAWSPDGLRIAYVNGEGDVLVIAPDGKEQKTIFEGPGYTIGREVSWSPDSQWILYRGIEGALLLSVQTGERIPVNALFPYFNMSWR